MSFYLASSTGLAEILEEAVGAATGTGTTADTTALLGTAIVLDFDRTLTNGYRSPEEMDIAKRIRGGTRTVAALERCKKSGADLYVVSARAGREMVLDTMALSFDGALIELKPIFMMEPMGEFQLVKVGEEQVAMKGALYATDYKKRAALLHIVTRMKTSKSGRKTILFFDDFVGNAYDIASMTWTDSNVELRSYWWDPFMEETQKQMSFASSDSTDNSYKQEYFEFGFLPRFGITKEIREARYKVYMENAPSQPKPEKSRPPPGKLKVDLGGFAKLALPGAGRGGSNVLSAGNSSQQGGGSDVS